MNPHRRQRHPLTLQRKSDSYLYTAAFFFTLTACGYSNEEGMDSQAIKLPNTNEGEAERRSLLDSATVDGDPKLIPQSLTRFIAGPEAPNICENALSQKKSCQPQLIKVDEAGQSLISFQTLNCEFVKPGDDDFEAPGGKTPKFYCRTLDDRGNPRTVKVKYANPEVHTEVAVTRMLWKMGFAVDVVHPVRVNCKGCPDNPWNYLKSAGQTDLSDVDSNRMTSFPYAAIEEKYPSEKIKIVSETGSDVLDGFTYDELLDDLENNTKLSQTQKDRRQALAFMNTFIANYDTKADNQRLGCIELSKDGDSCLRAVAIPHDVGYSFGDGIRDAKIHLKSWKNTPVWTDASTCDASKFIRVLGLEFGIRLQLTESGRKEIARLFDLFDDRHVNALFSVARFDGAASYMSRAAGDLPPSEARLAPQAWAEAFQARVADFRSVTRCPVDE